MPFLPLCRAGSSRRFVSAIAVVGAVLALAVAGLGAWLATSPPARTTPVAAQADRRPDAGRSERAGLAHALRLLRRSHDANTPVRILFYGQSITEQGWWLRVVDRLHVLYPHADLQVENRAIGGHSSELLRKTAEADVFPFQPDLVIFQAYGSHRDYESLIRAVREQTTADVMVASNHVTDDAELDEDTRPLRLDLRAWLYRLPKLVSAPTRLANWNAWLSYSFLPALAERHGLQTVDVRDEWKLYLAGHHLHAAQLLRDAIHLNFDGQSLMAEVIQRYLVPLPADAPDTANDDRLVELAPLPLPDAPGRPIRIAFQGTRVDAVLRTAPPELLPVSVDGAPPCHLPEAYRFDRVTRYPGTSWPTMLRVQPGGTPLRDETWTLTLGPIDRDQSNAAFTLSGSKTGSDGNGTSLARFVSASGRVVIEPGDWDLAYARATSGQTLPDGFAVHWRSRCLGTDALTPTGPPTAGPVTLVQGLRNGAHELVLPAAAAGSVAAIRIYRPPEGRE